MAHAQDTAYQEFYDIDGTTHSKGAVLSRGLLHLGIDYQQADLFNYTMMKASWTNSTACPAEADIITAFKARLVVEASLEYQSKRANEYPQFGEQLDKLYKDIVAGTVTTSGAFATAIKAVKDKYPKS